MSDRLPFKVKVLVSEVPQSPHRVMVLVSEQKSLPKRHRSRRQRRSQRQRSQPDRPSVKVNVMVSPIASPTASSHASPIASSSVSDSADETDSSAAWFIEPDPTTPCIQQIVSDLPQRRRRMKGAIGLGLLATIALLGAGSWVAARLIVNPGSVSWLSWLVSEANRTPLSETLPRSIAEIQAEIAQAGLQAGHPIFLSTYPGLNPHDLGFNDFFLPLFRPGKSVRSGEGAGEMVELRVYRLHTKILPQPQKAPVFDLVDRIAVQGPEEFEAIAPLRRTSTSLKGSYRWLPFTTVSFVEGTAPASGIWLHLSGVWERGSSEVTYGQVLRYDPIRTHLQPILPWSSLTEELPAWQPAANGKTIEFVVDQTLGAESRLKIYQVRSFDSLVQPYQLELTDASDFSESSEFSNRFAP